MTFLSSLFGATAQNSENIKVLSTTEFKEAISNKKVQLVDVRTASEFQSGHIKGALHIDYFDSRNFNKAFEKLDKEKPVYLYCRSGNRSNKASKKLETMGFTEIYDLHGGYMSWR